MKPKLIMMIGPAASGKSTWAQRLKAETDEEFIILSSDAIRKEIYGDEAIQKDPKKIFDLLHARARYYLLKGNNVIYDATNLLFKNRMAFLNYIKDIDCEKTAYIVVVPYEVCVGQNMTRERQVPESVIYRHFTQIQLPFKEEGWDHIYYTRDFYDKWYNIVEILDHMEGFNQDNPNHSLDLYNHCLEAYEQINDKVDDNWALSVAALLHDIGKLYTKTSVKMNGMIDGYSHYYGHDSFGAYVSLMIGEKDSSIYQSFNDNLSEDEEYHIALLINYHMLPFFGAKKLWNAFSQNFRDEITLLHEADKAAH